jgi:hypothetical protein
MFSCKPFGMKTCPPEHVSVDRGNLSLKFGLAIRILLPHSPCPCNGWPDEPIVIHVTLLCRLQKRLIRRLIVLCKSAVELHLRKSQCVYDGVDMGGEQRDVVPMYLPKKRDVRLGEVIGSRKCIQTFQHCGKGEL